ncbi:MAG: RHS repeat-associated core domain-containing protein [Polyangiaceae bacterium]|nr:RHS repeat-associated core domain-containing protein [Polyangiaceae bacterium]
MTDNYVIWLNDGTTSLYVDVDYTLWDLKDIRLTTLGGREYDIKYGGSVTRVGDAHGNSVQMQPTGLVNQPSGVGVTFVKDGSGRITSVVGPDGKSVKYAYGPTGDLTTVTDRKNQVTTFSYYFDHQLERVVDPAGTTPMRLEYDADGRMKKQFDANQNPEILDFNPLAGTAAVAGVNGAVTSAQFGANGQLTQVASPVGLPVKYEYDANGLVTKKTDELGQIWTFTYDAKWNLASETNPSGHTTGWASSYDAAGNRTKLVVSAPLKGPETLEYTAAGKLTKVTTPAGLVQTMAYDSKGQRTGSTETNGAMSVTTTMGYDAAGHKTSQVGPAGDTTLFEYDSRGRLTKRIAEHPAPAMDEITTFQYDDNDLLVMTTDSQGQTGTTYDANGRPTTLTSPGGGVVQQAYDPMGRLTLKTYPPTAQAPTGAKEAYAYDELGNVTGVLDRDGVFVEYEYDALGRRTKMIAGDGAATLFFYDALGRKTKEVNPLGHQRTWEVDAVGHVTKEVDETGAITLTAYDAAGRVTQMVDALGNARQYQYNPAGRRTAILYPDSTSEHFEYDVVGRETKMIGRGGQITSRGYDAAGHLTSMTDENGQSTTFGYDSVGHLTLVTDPKGNALTSVYDSAGRVVERTLPGGGMAETYAYDSAGRITLKTGFDGLTTAYEYDANSNLTKLTIQKAGSVMPTVYTLQPSPGGDRVTVADAHGPTTYTYDSLTGRLNEIETPEGMLSYGYDAAGRITSRATPEGTTSYEYDQAGRVTLMSDSRIGMVNYTHDALGRLANVVMPDGGTTAYTHDSMSRLLSVTHNAPNGTLLLSFTHQYDANGRRTQITETSAGGTSTVVYAYDAKGQLTLENRPTGVITYAYDAAGHRTSKTDPNGTVLYSYDAQGKLTASTVEDFFYDGAGRLTKRQAKNGSNVTTYQYDAEGRLLTLTPPSGMAMSFAYDIDGIRYSQTVAGNKVDYLVDPLREYAEVVGEYDSNGQPIASYVYGGSGRAADVRDNIKLFYLNDAQSVRALRPMGTQGTSDAYTFSAFGEVLASSGTSPNGYGFQGEATDVSGLVYLRARYLDPSLGRFLTRDPVSGEPPYSFAHNDPPNKTDPTGRTAGLLLAPGGGMVAFASAALPRTIQVILLWWRLRRTQAAVATAFGLAAVVSRNWNDGKTVDEVKGELEGKKGWTISLAHTKSKLCEGTARGDAGTDLKGDKRALYTSGELNDSFQGFMRKLLEAAIDLRKALFGKLTPDCAETYGQIARQITSWDMGNCAEKSSLFWMFEGCGASTDEQKLDVLCNIDQWDTVRMDSCSTSGHIDACAQCCLFFLEIQKLVEKEVGSCPVSGVVGGLLQQPVCLDVVRCLATP